MKRLSEAQRHMLRNVAAGHVLNRDRARPYQVGNTNRTASALLTLGLITLADDQTEARRTLDRAYVITEAGREALK